VTLSRRKPGTGVTSSYEDAKQGTDEILLAKEVPPLGASQTETAIHVLLCLSPLLFGQNRAESPASPKSPIRLISDDSPVTQRVSHDTCPSPKVIAVILMFTKPPLPAFFKAVNLMEIAYRRANSSEV